MATSLVVSWSCTECLLEQLCSPLRQRSMHCAYSAQRGAKLSSYLGLGKVFLGRGGDGIWVSPRLGGSLFIQWSLSAVLGGKCCCLYCAALVTRLLALIGRNCG